VGRTTDRDRVTHDGERTSPRPYDGERDAVWAVHDRALRASAVAFDSELDRYLRRPGRAFRAGECLVGVLDVSPPPDPARRGPAGERVVAVGGYHPATADAAAVGVESPVDPTPGTVEVRAVRVGPACRRRGHGRRLVGAMEPRASEAGFEWTVLNTSVALRAARGLYESLGDEAVGHESRGDAELVRYERAP
jgi:ribosomal protein S18 acetylase RimI-like enzyme